MHAWVTCRIALLIGQQTTRHDRLKPTGELLGNTDRPTYILQMRQTDGRTYPVVDNGTVSTYKRPPLPQREFRRIHRHLGYSIPQQFHARIKVRLHAECRTVVISLSNMVYTFNATTQTMTKPLKMTCWFYGKFRADFQQTIV
jgi:hypothetical protein